MTGREQPVLRAGDGYSATTVGRAMEPNTSGAGAQSDQERGDQITAIDDEYTARASDAQVIADFGDVRPFSNIIAAGRGRQRHRRGG